MNTKKILTLMLAAAASKALVAQSNTFPSSGEVGIGTTSPELKLHIFNASANQLLQLESGDPEVGIELRDSNAQDNDVVLWGIGDEFAIHTGNEESFRINGDGLVGIGTNSPIESLSIYGSGGTDPQSIGIGPGVGRRWIITADGWDFQPQHGKYPLVFEHEAGGYDGDFVVKQSGGSLVVKQNGNVGIGTVTPDNKLDVSGTIRAREVIVETGWSDFVFEDGYYLRSLEEVEAHIDEYGHLPEVPSAKTVESEGLSVGEAQKVMMQKIEELTLYMIDLKQENDALKLRVAELETN